MFASLLEFFVQDIQLSLSLSELESFHVGGVQFRLAIKIIQSIPGFLRGTLLFDLEYFGKIVC